MLFSNDVKADVYTSVVKPITGEEVDIGEVFVKGQQKNADFIEVQVFMKGKYLLNTRVVFPDNDWWSTTVFFDQYVRPGSQCRIVVTATQLDAQGQVSSVYSTYVICYFADDI